MAVTKSWWIMINSVNYIRQVAVRNNLFNINDKEVILRDFRKDECQKIEYFLDVIERSMNNLDDLNGLCKETHFWNIAVLSSTFFPQLTREYLEHHATLFTKGREIITISVTTYSKCQRVAQVA